MGHRRLVPGQSCLSFDFWARVRLSRTFTPRLRIPHVRKLHSHGLDRDPVLATLPARRPALRLGALLLVGGVAGRHGYHVDLNECRRNRVAPCHRHALKKLNHLIDNGR